MFDNFLSIEQTFFSQSTPLQPPFPFTFIVAIQLSNTIFFILDLCSWLLISDPDKLVFLNLHCKQHTHPLKCCLFVPFGNENQNSREELDFYQEENISWPFVGY
jgi:hypothetical protein